VSEVASTLWCMAGIVDLMEWRRRHPSEPTAHPSLGDHGDGVTSDADPSITSRLERAVERLYPLVERALRQSGGLQPRVETELLAIMGELTVGLVTEAAGRAERLVGKLEASG